MKVISFLKVCVLAAFVGTLLTGALFIMRSSNEQEMRAHVKDIYSLNGVQKKIDAKNADIQEEKNLRKSSNNRNEANELDKLSMETVYDKYPNSDDKEMERNIQPPVKVDMTKEEPVKDAQKPAEEPAVTITTPIAAAKSVTVAEKVLNELKEVKESATPPSVHIFYYPWYGAPAHDNGKYYHWNHRRIKPWNKSVEIAQNVEERHKPPGDVASSYYPQLGPYSSRDPVVIERHMKWLSSAGIDVVSVSWYPKGKSDDEGVPWDSLIPLLLNMTSQYKMKLNFHLEPYDSRTVASVREDIEYIILNYGSHPAFYRTTGKKKTDKSLPLFYIYDSYRIPPNEWLAITDVNGSATIRNTNLDSLLIGLYVDSGDENKIKNAGFDGLYTYFAADGFSHGSTMHHWPALSAYCAKQELLFVPSVGPGYDDTRVRPWNAKNQRSRNGGEYYKEHFKMAHTAMADIVSITSFNEWHEGTQIEPAIPFTDTNGTDFVYATYEKGPEQYLEITLEMIKTYFTAHHDNIAAKVARVV